MQSPLRPHQFFPSLSLVPLELHCSLNKVKIRILFPQEKHSRCYFSALKFDNQPRVSSLNRLEYTFLSQNQYCVFQCVYWFLPHKSQRHKVVSHKTTVHWMFKSLYLTPANYPSELPFELGQTIEFLTLSSNGGHITSYLPHCNLIKVR